jgi:hypothetical protein
MNADLKHLEEQVEAMLSPLAGDLDRFPPPGEAVLQRVKAAARHEINEQWLTTQPVAEPPSELVANVQAAVRDELGRCNNDRRRMAAQKSVGATNRRWLAGLAAAAMMAICAGVAQRAGTWSPAPARSVDMAMVKDSPVELAALDHQPVDLFIEAAEAALAVEDEAASRRSPAAARNENSPERVLDDLDEAMQDILSKPEPKGSTMAEPPAGQGAVG